jgi:hypothetical protein
MVVRIFGILPEFNLMMVLEDSEVGAKVNNVISKAERNKKCMEVRHAKSHCGSAL